MNRSINFYNLTLNKTNTSNKMNTLKKTILYRLMQKNFLEITEHASSMTLDPSNHVTMLVGRIILLKRQI